MKIINDYIGPVILIMGFMTASAIAGADCAACLAVAAPVLAKETTAETTPQAEAIINTEGLKALLDSKVPVILLDARSGKWDDGKRIPGAKSLDAAATPDQVAAVIPAKEALVVTYCSNRQCPASGKLAKHLVGLGYSNVIEFPEGIAGWIEKGHAVVDAVK